MKLLAVLVLTVAMSGCALVPGQREADPSAARSFTVKRALPAVRSPELDQANLENSLQSVLDFCLPRLSGYEIKSSEQARQAFWLQMSGLVAGSVLSPMLIAGGGSLALTAGLAGWAGAVPFAAQTLRTSGLSGSAIAATRNDIIRNLKANIIVASDSAKSFEERAGAIMRARTECVIYEIAVPQLAEGQN